MSKIKKWFFLISLLLFCFLSFPVLSQDINAHSPHTNGGSYQQRKADKKKAKLQKKIARGVEKAKKQHLKLQTNNTKKMMKASKRKSKKWNSNRK